MRFSKITMFALSGLAIASPVVTKRDTEADVVSLLTDLYATVQTYTGAINATLANLSPSSSALEKTAAAPAIGDQINKITAAITSTTSEINALPHVSATKAKRFSNSVEVQEVEKRQVGAIAVAALLGLIIVEVLATLGAAILVLGAGLIVVFTTPMVSSLSLLILTVQAVLNVVLAGVITLLNTILTSLALGLSGL